MQRYGGIKRIGVITPYMPVGDEQVRRFFTDCGFEVVRLDGLKCASPVLIAHVSETRAARRDPSRSTDPTSKPSSRSAPIWRWRGSPAIAEFWLDKPVLAINTATYWWALRRNGIADKIDGFGSLLLDH